MKFHSEQPEKKVRMKCHWTGGSLTPLSKLDIALLNKLFVGKNCKVDVYLQDIKDKK